MKLCKLVCLGTLALNAAVAIAQDSLVGRYTGSFQFPGPFGETPHGVTLVIAGVEADQVKGSLDLNSRGACAGAYPMQGTLKEGKLTLRGKGGRGGDCGISLDLTPQGSKLIGTVGPKKTPIELSR